MDSAGHTRIPSTPLRFHDAERPIRPDVRARRNAARSAERLGTVRALRALMGPRRSSSSSGGSGRGGGVQTGARFPQWMYAQRVVVKARVVRSRGSAGRQTMRAHVKYLERDGVDLEGGEGRAFDADEFLSPEAMDAFVDRAADDRHHFRFIVSPERGSDLDLTEYARDLMSQAERDLGTSLQWVAVAHHNTDNPHVHMIVRGVDERGADLVISREYIARGLRERGQEIATRELGLRVERDIEKQRSEELRADRVTSLDRQLEREADTHAGLLDLRPPAHRVPGASSERARLEKIARLHHLESRGLAIEVQVGRWKLAPEALARLQEIGNGERLSTSFYRFIDRSYRFNSIKLYEKAQPDAPNIEGELVARGKLEEFDDRDTIFVAANRGALAGRVYRLTLGPFSEDPSAPLRVGQQVRLGVHRRADVSPADRNILRVASQAAGHYSIERHREVLGRQARQGLFALDDLEERLEGHLRRIEGHERRGFVERVGRGVWRVPPDLEQRLEEHGRSLGDRALTPQVTPLARASLDEQILARGPTWLDGQLVSGEQLQGQSPEAWSAPKRLHTALRQRTAFLGQLGIVVTQGALRQEQLERLYRLEVHEAAHELAKHAQLGRFLEQGELPARGGGLGERREFTGQIHSFRSLMSGRHVVLLGSGEFTILPIKTSSRLEKGQQVSAVVSAAAAPDPGRPRGAQSIVRYTDLQRSREIQRGRELGD